VVGLQPLSSFPLERLWQLEARAAVAFQSQLESQQQERLQLLLFPSFFQQPSYLLQRQRDAAERQHHCGDLTKARRLAEEERRR